MNRIRLVPACLLLTLLLAGSAFAQDIWPEERWATSPPEDQHLNPALFDSLDRRIRDGNHGNIDRMLVVRRGYLVVDHEYELNYNDISRGRRTAIGCGLDACADPAESSDPFNYLHPGSHPFYQGRAVHTLQSVTKSVAATAVGVALMQGAIDSLGVPLVGFLQEYDLSGTDPRLQQATLEDLLTMRSGIEWHEQDRPLNETNTTIQLERSDDWVQFTLDQPMDANPGEKWVYNSGGSHLMSQVVRSATGMFMQDFAGQFLFGPLQIPDYHWKTTPKGLADTEGGLYLEADQLAKIGYLYLRGGMWKNERILSEEFVRASVARQVDQVNNAGWGYGYQWWRLDRGETQVWAGLGFGGQYLLVLPEYDLIGVVNSWNVFGERVAPILGDFLSALIESVQ